MQMKNGSLFIPLVSANGLVGYFLRLHFFLLYCWLLTFPRRSDINYSLFLLNSKAKVFRPMDVDMSNRFTTLRETADDAEEEESVPRLDDDSEEPSLRAVRKQRLTCTNLLPSVASFLKLNLISKFW